MPRLYSVYCNRTHCLFGGVVPNGCSLEEIDDALDKAMNDPDSIHVREKIVAQAGLKLFGNPDELKHLLDYASKRSIPVVLAHELTSDRYRSMSIYLNYLGTHASTMPTVSIARTEFVDRMIRSLQYCHEDRFVLRVKILVNGGFNFREVARDERNTGSIEHALHRSSKLLCYEDFVRFLDISSGSKWMMCLKHLTCLNTFKLSFGLLNYSIQNPDGKVFDLILDNFPIDTVLHASIPYIDDFNPRSLVKLVKLNLSCGNDLARQLRVPYKVDAFQLLALLGTYKDTLLLDTLISLGLTRSYGSELLTREALRAMDHLADMVISCLRTKLPNVLVDLVLQYLV